MNFGILGYGNIAKRFFKSIQHTTNGEVTAIGSKSLFSNDTFKEEHPNIHIYQTYEEVLQDPTIDGIYIALPHDLHKKWALEALVLNIPVFCEKPATLTLPDMKEITKSSQDNQTLFVEAFKTKFNVGMDQLKEDLSLIAPVKSVETNFCSDARHLKKTTSYLFKEDQGGALNDIGTYVLGFILDLIDSPIKSIDAKLKMVDGVDEQFAGTIYFENGTEGIFEGAIDRDKERTAIIKGEKGTIIVPMYNRIESYEIMLKDGQNIQRHYPIVGDDMTKEIQSFIDLVEAKETISSRHSLEETELIIETIETIRALKNK